MNESGPTAPGEAGQARPDETSLAKPGRVAPTDELRQATIDLLCEAFAKDEVEMEDFERRVELVNGAETVAELRVIVADLPSAASQPPDRAADGRGAEGALAPRVEGERRYAPTRPRATLPPERIPDQGFIVGVFGGGGRKGQWVAARTNWAIGVMGGCELDFRDAQLGPGVTEVRVFALCGGIDVVVPPDVAIECSGAGILGAFEGHGTLPETTSPDAPVIRVTGLAIMGGVGVTVRHSGETAREARRRLRSERKQLRRLRKGG